ncbi:MAG TPA: hypothetical protein VFI65_32445 [Streptosporangiaceae bacterium]|nr:hypothetical protein [Streptosporangiaceae bacterium]
MNVRTAVAVSAVPGMSEARLAWARRSSLAVLALLVVEYGLGMYVNLYVVVPAADHGGSLGEVISEGPVMLSVHATVGLLLGLVALATLVHAIRCRRWAVIALAALGFFAVAFAAFAGAAFAGAAFTSTGDTADSMAMSVMTGVALLCYAINLYLLGRPARRSSEV